MLIPTTFTPHSTKGTFKEHIPGSLLQDAPVGTTHILMIVDPDDEISETFEDNNVREVADVHITVESQVLGTLSEHSKTVIKNLLRIAGDPEVSVSSYLRTPADQARIMFDEILRRGVAAEKLLYADAGDSVVDAFIDITKENHWTTKKLRLAHRAEIEEAMVDQINLVGKENVSSHMKDPSELQAIDLRPSTFAAATRARFVHATAELQTSDPITHVKADGDVLRAFKFPPKDPAYHLEIWS